MAIRVQMDSLGIPTVSDPEKSVPGTPSQDTSSSSTPSPYRTGKIVTRLQMDDEGGSTFTNLSQQTATQRDLPSAPSKVVSVMSPSGGVKASLAMAEENDIVNLGPGLGDSSVKAWMQLGLIEPNPNGRGFRLVGQSQAWQEQVAQKDAEGAEGPKAKQVDNDEVVTEADLQGVQSTSPQADATLAQIRDNAPASVEAIVHAVGSDLSPDWQDIARQTGDETILQRGEQMVEEYRAAGRQVLSNLGVSDHDAFVSWAVSTEPEKARDAVRSMMDGNAGPLAALGRRYAKSLQTPVGKLKAEAATAASYSTEDVLSANFGGGIRAFRSGNGQAVLDIPGRGKVEFNEAVRLGYIRVTRTK